METLQKSAAKQQFLCTAELFPLYSTGFLLWGVFLSFLGFFFFLITKSFNEFWGVICLAFKPLYYIPEFSIFEFKSFLFCAATVLYVNTVD